MSPRRLPVVGQGALRGDGRHAELVPADVHGRFSRARKLLFVALMGVLSAVPVSRIGGHPVLLLDLPGRHFYVLGRGYNAQDTWLLFFVLTGFAFGLVAVTTVLGRVWCGWACPQTVFLEGLYRRVERLIEGPREQHLRRDAGPWTAGRVLRKAACWVSYTLLSLLLAHVFLGYFAPLPEVLAMVRRDPSQHPEAFAWVLATTAVLTFNFGWFREQFCLVLCPYGRLQSALFDPDTVLVGYDARRGEPRGKASDSAAGACVDCKRCVVVCPTGIDVRDGALYDCIGCTACIDACDEVMDKLGRPRGLVRHDSQRGFAGERRRWLRPRLAVYAVLLLVGFAVAAFALGTRREFEANVLRLAGMPYTIDGNRVRNGYTVHLVNKSTERTRFSLVATAMPGVEVLVGQPELELGPGQSAQVPVFVVFDRGARTGDFTAHLRLHAPRLGPAGEAELTLPVLAPAP